jgi:hypothetical protein
MKDADYVKSKLRHMKVIGINASVNPETGAAQPDWAKNEAAERHAHHNRIRKVRAEKEKVFNEAIHKGQYNAGKNI